MHPFGSPISRSPVSLRMTLSYRTTARRLAGLAMLALCTLAPRGAGAQVRERPIPFDSAGRVLVITPPLAARLGLAPPAWSVSGDYVDARLYAVDDTTGGAVLVVRRPREVLERYPLATAQRLELFAPAAAALTGNAAAGTAVYLAVAGGTFFFAADRARRSPVSNAENHLAWHGARHGVAAAALATYALGGEKVDEKAVAAALLAGGIFGDLVG